MKRKIDYIAAVSDFAVELVDVLTRRNRDIAHRIADDVANGGHLKLAIEFEGQHPTVGVSMVMPSGDEHHLARNIST